MPTKSLRCNYFCQRHSHKPFCQCFKTPPHKKRGFEKHLTDSTVWLNQLTIQCFPILISFFAVYYFIILEHRSTTMFVRVSLATAIAFQTRSWRKLQFTVGIRKRPIYAHRAFPVYLNYKERHQNWKPWKF